MMRTAWVIFLKELGENLRDRRSLLSMGVISIAAGPLLLLALSNLLAGYESRAERNIAVVAGIEHAPHLRNFMLRNGFRIETAPLSHAEQLKSGKLVDPVLVIPPGFEQSLISRAHEHSLPTIDILTDSANRLAHSGVARLQRLLVSYENHLATYQLALEGRSPAAADRFSTEVRDLSSEQARAAKLLGMLPFFLIMAGLYAAWSAAMESIAGERERGIRDALLATPASVRTIVMGKWAAISVFAGILSTLATWSFLPTQYLIDSEQLRTTFALTWRDCMMVTMALWPLCGLVAAVMMLAAVGAQTLRAAQAQSSLAALLVALLPIIGDFSSGGAVAPSPLWPVIAQSEFVHGILEGTAPDWSAMSLATLSCAVGTGVLLLWVAHRYPRGR